MEPQLTGKAQISAELSEEAISFRSASCLLRGIETLPTNASPAETGVVFVHGWSGNRSGPHGLLTTMAREFAQTGMPCLRFDFRGRGESEGEGLEASLPTMAEDLSAASQFFAARNNLKKLVYFAVCSGGNVTIGNLPNLPLAKSLILLSVYPFSDGDAFGRDVHRTWHYARVYWNKAMHPDTWRRLFKGDVSIGGVFNVLFGHFLNRGRNKKKEEVNEPPPESTPRRAAGKVAKASASESRNESKEAPKKHLAKLRADLPVLMLYGTADPDAPAALTYFGDYCRENKLPIQFIEIDGANHNFSSKQWMDRVKELSREFLQNPEVQLSEKQ